MTIGAPAHPAAPEAQAGTSTGAGTASEAWQRLRAISHDPAALAGGRQLMEETGLSLGPVKALRLLPLTGAIPMRQLAARLGCDNSYVTSLVDALEERGLAARASHPTDRRVKVIVLTDEGRPMAVRAQEAYATPPPAFAALSDDEVATLCELLRKLDSSEA